MMNFEKYFSSNEGDEGCSFSLSEKDWHSYLLAIDSEIAKFFKLFIQTRHISNHLDLVFTMMKWRRVIFTNERSDDDVEVVTFHKNPVYIASRAILFFIEKLWDFLLQKCPNVTPSLCWEFAKLINTVKDEMLCGVVGVDSCDFLLSVCHFKNLVAAIDKIFLLVNRLPDLPDDLQGFYKDIQTALFDIRELAWQSIMLCKNSDRHYNDNSSF